MVWPTDGRQRPEHCRRCLDAPTGAPGAYCARLRCYCGHPECPATGYRAPAVVALVPPLAETDLQRALRERCEQASQRAAPPPRPAVVWKD